MLCDIFFWQIEILFLKRCMNFWKSNYYVVKVWSRYSLNKDFHFLYPLDEKIKYMNKVLVFSVLKYRPIIMESSPTHVGAVPKLCLRRTNHVENMSRSKNHQLDKVEVVVDVMEGCPRLACSSHILDMSQYRRCFLGMPCT